MKDRVSVALESYLEQIADLQKEHGAVRTSDLADRMGCRRSSVTNALQRLSEKGLINYQSYRPVTLTAEGEKTIKALSRYHGILADFLENILAFPEKFAQEEACRLEHRVSQSTIERMRIYIEFIEQTDNLDRGLASAKFKEFMQKR
ncbi:MAG: metal-dependent transcriptional regulator [Candidatus Riflebacteria bacterium HGW-Riflebacteria-2]|jgi:DtxR family Mn-dependent transcriptional regulator|nr:MAG: metal-dependent transcriptional regulator [Candidatus Riflebacteria bacterium HGW-Riflebacteria-2]